MSPEATEQQEDNKILRVPGQQERRKSARREEDKDDVATSISQKRDKFNSYTPEKHRENIRGIVTAVLVGVFSLCILALVYFGLRFTAIYASNLKEALEGLTAIGGMLSAYVVPIITFVLGFYFGSEKKS